MYIGPDKTETISKTFPPSPQTIVARGKSLVTANFSLYRKRLGISRNSYLEYGISTNAHRNGPGVRSHMRPEAACNGDIP